jgi:PilZ domain
MLARMAVERRNQRRHARIQPRAMSSRVRVGGALHIGLGVENISMGGAFVRCGQAPPLKSHATLELMVPGVNQPLMLPGKVAFVVTAADASTRKVAAGFAIEFIQPLPPQLQRGLERLLGSIDPSALVPMVREPARVEEPVPTEQEEELGALRLRFASMERENVRLKRENEELKARLQKVLGASRVATPRER